MMLVSVIHATKVQCVTPTLSMAVPFALVQLALLVAPATRTWMSVLLVCLLLFDIYNSLFSSIMCSHLPAGANPCEHFGKCVNTEGSFQCQCGRGYAGPRCEIDINECLSMPCQNDATCLDRIGEFTCICMPGT